MPKRTVSVCGLFRVKQKALRKKAWFKVLDKKERIITNLTIGCVKRIRSFGSGLRSLILELKEKVAAEQNSQTLEEVS